LIAIWLHYLPPLHLPLLPVRVCSFWLIVRSLLRFWFRLVGFVRSWLHHGLRCGLPHVYRCVPCYRTVYATTLRFIWLRFAFCVLPLRLYGCLLFLPFPLVATVVPFGRFGSTLSVAVLRYLPFMVLRLALPPVGSGCYVPPRLRLFGCVRLPLILFVDVVAFARYYLPHSPCWLLRLPLPSRCLRLFWLRCLLVPSTCYVDLLLGSLLYAFSRLRHSAGSLFAVYITVCRGYLWFYACLPVGFVYFVTTRLFVALYLPCRVGYGLFTGWFHCCCVTILLVATVRSAGYVRVYATVHAFVRYGLRVVCRALQFAVLLRVTAFGSYSSVYALVCWLVRYLRLLVVVLVGFLVAFWLVLLVRLPLVCLGWVHRCYGSALVVDSYGLLPPRCLPICVPDGLFVTLVLTSLRSLWFFYVVRWLRFTLLLPLTLFATLRLRLIRCICSRSPALVYVCTLRLYVCCHVACLLCNAFVTVPRGLRLLFWFYVALSPGICLRFIAFTTRTPLITLRSATVCYLFGSLRFYVALVLHVG